MIPKKILKNPGCGTLSAGNLEKSRDTPPLLSPPQYSPTAASFAAGNSTAFAEARGPWRSLLFAASVAVPYCPSEPLSILPTLQRLKFERWWER